MEEKTDLVDMLSAAQQLQQQRIARLNQLEMEKWHLTQEVFQLQGRIGTLQQLLQLDEKGKVIKFPEKKESE